MKKFLQLFLFLILILISWYSYFNYFKVEKVNNVKISDKKEISSEENSKNFIKNLKYEIKFENNAEYTLNAESSEITYKDQIEIVLMKKVNAFFINKKGLPLIIQANKAIYDNSNHNTNFYDNVEIEYLGNKISSDNLNLDFTKNIAVISNNVVYDGVNGQLKTDNIKINIDTRDIKIFMNNSNDKVKITSK